MTSLPRVRASGLAKVAVYAPGETFGPRRLSDYEFVWLLDGSATWSTASDVDGVTREHSLAVGDLVLATQGTVDSYQWDLARPSRHGYVHFSIEDLGDLGQPGGWPVVRSLYEHPVLDGLCRRLAELAASAQRAAQPRTDQVVGLLLDTFVGLQPEPPVPARLQVVADHLARVWGSDGLRLVEVVELAAAARVSPGHLFRLFRTEYGTSPARALELLRLSRAATSLERSNATLAAIAAGTGFANAYHLSRRFTAVYGCPPGRYRAMASRPDPLEPLRAAGLLGLARAALPMGRLPAPAAG